MDRRKTSLIALNCLCGSAVLLGYWFGVRAVSGAELWGGVPQALQPANNVNMLLAAAGYLPFTYYIAFRPQPENTRIAGRFDYTLFHWLYLLILIPSAAWLPLTANLIASPGPLAWWGVRFVLFLVALGALGLVAALLRLGAEAPPGRALALVGLAPFCLQTVVLDPIIWPFYFYAPPATGAA